MKKPLITISIPTYNSEPFLDKCLSAIKNQTYKQIEINIIDGGSKDNTVNIAKSYGITSIKVSKDALLGARYEGMMMAKGEYVLLLDSDQILKKDTIENSINLFMTGNYDMLVLEEGVYKQETFIEKLFALDRKLIQTVKDFSPYTGVMLPRFYKKSVLSKAFRQIPKPILRHVGGQDHAIIYLEAWNVTQKVGIVPHAVKHIEPSSYKTMWKKFFRWGYTSVNAHHGKYNELLGKKERFRTGLFSERLITASFASILLLVLKGLPYKLGYYWGKFTLK